MDIDINRLLALPPAERLRLAELLWDSVPAGESAPLPPGHREELERRLAEYPEDDGPGRPVAEVMAELRSRL